MLALRIPRARHEALKRLATVVDLPQAPARFASARCSCGIELVALIGS